MPLAVLLLTVIAVTGGLSAVAVTTAAPAQAHDRLLISSPADGATVTAEQARVIRLSFVEDVLPLGSDIVVTGPTGTAKGEVGTAGRDLIQRLDEVLPTGRHAVTWRAVSADGHPISGRFSFAVQAKPGTAATEMAPSGAAVAPTTAAKPTVGTDGSLLTSQEPKPPEATNKTGRYILGFCVLGAGLVGGLVIVNRRRPSSSDSATRTGSVRT